MAAAPPCRSQVAALIQPRRMQRARTARHLSRAGPRLRRWRLSELLWILGSIVHSDRTHVRYCKTQACATRTPPGAPFRFPPPFQPFLHGISRCMGSHLTTYLVETNSFLRYSSRTKTSQAPVVFLDLVRTETNAWLRRATMQCWAGSQPSRYSRQVRCTCR